MQLWRLKMANNTTFGGPTFNSEVEFNIGISDDKKAFTATFGGLGTRRSRCSLDGVSANRHTRIFFCSPAVGRRPGYGDSLFRFRLCC